MTIRNVSISRMVCWMVVLSLAGAITAFAEDPINLDSLLRAESRKHAETVTSPVNIVEVAPDVSQGAPGPVFLKIALSPNFRSDLSVAVVATDKLQCVGRTEWSFNGSPADTFHLVIEAMIPQNDTSSLTYKVSSGPWSFDFIAYFAAGSDSVSCTFYDPRVWPPRSSMRYKEIWQDFSDSLRPESSRPGGTMRIGYYDDAGGFIPQDSMDLLDSIAEADTLTHWIGPRTRSKVWIPAEDGGRILVDTAWLLDSLRQVKVEKQLADLHLREATPCTSDGERAWIDGWFYQRHRGEYTFRKSRGTTDPEGRSRAILDSLAGEFLNRILHYSVDLSDPSDLDFVRQRVDSLEPIEPAGFYHITATKAVIDEIEKAGIKIKSYPLDAAKAGSRSTGKKKQ